MATLHAPDYIVEESVLEVNRKTGMPREIDIRVTNKKNPKEKILIECRDHKRKQDVTWIDALDGKARSLGFNKVVAVSSSGFYKRTEKEAKSRGIDILHLREAEDKDWKKWLFNITEFGVVFDFRPVVKKINLVSPDSTKPPSLKNIAIKDVFLVNRKLKQKVLLKDYIKRLVKNPKLVNYVRDNNEDEAITHYNYGVPCDKGVGYVLPGGVFVPLQEIIFSLDSVRRSYKVPMRHLRAGDNKILVGEGVILGNESRVVLEEQKGLLKVMIESKIKKVK